jgi:hypothetical protein
MLMRVRACGVPVKLMTMGIILSWVPCQCERSQECVCKWSAVLHVEMMGILKDIIRAVYPFADLSFANG